MSNLFHFPHSKCWMCIFIPVALSGVVGFLAGNLCLQLGVSASSSSAIAGFSGFMGAQAFNFTCLLLTSRYNRSKKAECRENAD